MIQGIISRLGGNLFFLKGWSITVIAALIALSAKDAHPNYILFFVFPVFIFIFWILDGFFLSKEKQYRELYDDVRKLDEKQIDFSMHTEKYEKYFRNTWIFAMFSATLMWFYFPLLVVLFVIILINLN